MEIDISKLIARILTKSANNEEKKQLHEWLDKSENNRIAFNKIFAYWSLENKTDVDDGHMKSVFGRLMYRIKMQQSRKTSFRYPNVAYWKIAAVLFFVVSIAASILLLTNNVPTQSEFAVSTSSGQRSQAILPDGTKVWLNASTNLVMDAGFGGSERNVHLDGEAYFEVAHDKTKPFQVDIHGTIVKVLGTTFNIRGYSDEEIITTSLLNGSVVIVGSNNKGQYKLMPGQSATYNKADNTLKIQNENGTEISGWRNGVVVLNSVPFNKLMQRLERQYDVKIEYEPKDFYDTHYSGKLDNLRLDQVFDFISYSIPITYTMENKNVTIKKLNK